MKKIRVDYFLLFISLLLIIFGLLMVYSASNVVAMYKYNDQFYFIKRQLIFAVISIIVLFASIRLNLNIIYKNAVFIFLFGVILLIIVLIPGVGLQRGGARSWIGIGSLSFQPAEFCKICLIFLLSKIFSLEEKHMYRLVNFICSLTLVLVIFCLIMLQPDFGTGIVIVLTSVILLFISGARIKYFVFLALLGVIGIVGLIISAPYRLERIYAFIDPFSDPLGSGFQAIQSIYALAPSGFFGLGYNNSIQKNFFLPEPQNDFIFAIVCEELGLIGGLLLLAMFLMLIYRIYKIGVNCCDKFQQYLCFGVGISFFVQVFINVGVVIGLLPITGVTLPIISYGGSSLLMTVFQIGIVLNISSREVDI